MEDADADRGMSTEPRGQMSVRATAFSIDSLLSDVPRPSWIQQTGCEDCRSRYDDDLMNVECSLQSGQLWRKFHQFGTEMIITKNGRRMFPLLGIQVSGLRADCVYDVTVDFVPVNRFRYRYVYRRSRWTINGVGHGNVHRTPIYQHSSSLRCMQQTTIVFDKLKLTNNPNSCNKRTLLLQSMHKYQPRFHVSVRSTDTKFSHRCAKTFQFVETQFIAVTAYQNQQVTKLKIECNPFAKGFRESFRRAQLERLMQASSTLSGLSVARSLSLDNGENSESSSAAAATAN